MMWLGIVGVALGGITLALLLSGDDGRAEISAELSESIPEIAGFFEVSTMADLREFNEPSADLRARFTSSGEVYRVIDSSVDGARIAMWRMDVPWPGPGPFSSDPDRGFSTEEIVVGTAFASISRSRDASPMSAHQTLGRAIGRKHKGHQGRRGYSFIDHAVDYHSRLACSEILLDEKKETATGFWRRANAFFAGHGISVPRVITDNSSCYRSGAFQAALGPGIKHTFTRPIGRKRRGKPSNSNAPWKPNGPTPPLTHQTKPAPPPTSSGPMTAITTDLTAASETFHPSTLFTTTLGFTSSLPVMST